jgi:serine protease Do
VDLRVTVVEMTEQRVASQEVPSAQVFGLTVDNINPKWRKQFTLSARSGVVVINVQPGSVADDGGIQRGDVIREVNRKPVKNLNDYRKAMEQTEKDQVAVFLLQRGNASLYVTLKAS